MYLRHYDTRRYKLNCVFSYIANIETVLKSPLLRKTKETISTNNESIQQYLASSSSNNTNCCQSESSSLNSHSHVYTIMYLFFCLTLIIFDQTWSSGSSLTQNGIERLLKCQQCKLNCFVIHNVRRWHESTCQNPFYNVFHGFRLIGK